LRLQNASAPIWLAIVDLDQFKQVNDRCGLVVGDRVLQQVAQSLAHSVRRDDLVVRLGGDEFGVLLSGIDESAARGVLERLRSAVSGRPADESVGSVTVSIGYASSDNAAIDCAQLLAAAERGLRCAKQSGGDCVCRAGDE
jgi:diguanylate cyclase (GGDEF)-like protein